MKKRISIGDFEKMVANRFAKVCHRKKIGDLTVFVADGHNGNVYKTWYAVGTPEKLDFAQILEFPKWEKINGVLLPSSRDWRIKAALEKAEEIIPYLKRTPIYAR